MNSVSRAALQNRMRSLIASERSPYLPSLRHLATHFGVSRTTIAESVHQLQKEGLVRIQPRGKITIVGKDAVKTEASFEAPSDRTYQYLVRGIRDRKYPYGSCLPKSKYLCALLRVSPRTLVAAFRRLQAEKLCYKSGREWKVGTPPARLHPTLAAHKTVLVLGASENCWRNVYRDKRLSNFARSFTEASASMRIRLMYAIASHSETNSRYPVSGKRKIAEQIRILENHFVGTLIIANRHKMTYNEILSWVDFPKKSGKPVVWLDGNDTGKAWRGSGNGPYRCHYCEQAVVKAAIRFLAERGHQKVSFTFDGEVRWQLERGEMLREFADLNNMRVTLDPWDKAEHWDHNAATRFTPRLEALWSLGIPSFQEAVETLAKCNGFGAKASLSELKEIIFSPLGETQLNPVTRIDEAVTRIRRILSFDHLLADKSLTAAIFPNDLFAKRALLSLKKAQLSLPTWVSLLSFDNVPPGAPSFFNSVDTGFGELGYQAIHALLGDVPVRTDRNGNIPIRPEVVDHGTVAVIPEKDGASLSGWETRNRIRGD